MEVKRGTRNGSYTILEAKYIERDHGYVIAKNKMEYVTWRFVNQGLNISYYGGHYVQIDHDSPTKSMAQAYADYHSRIADAYNTLAKYGC